MQANGFRGRMSAEQAHKSVIALQFKGHREKQCESHFDDRRSHQDQPRHKENRPRECGGHNTGRQEP